MISRCITSVVDSRKSAHIPLSTSYCVDTVAHIQSSEQKQLASRNYWRAKPMASRIYWRTISAIGVVLYNCIDISCSTRCQCSSIIRKYSTLHWINSVVFNHKFITLLASRWYASPAININHRNRSFRTKWVVSIQRSIFRLDEPQTPYEQPWPAYGEFSG